MTEATRTRAAHRVAREPPLEQFRRWRADINDLIAIRQNSKDVLIALGDERVADLCFQDDDEDWDLDE
jgi:hypothetical protein